MHGGVTDADDIDLDVISGDVYDRFDAAKSSQNFAILSSWLFVSGSLAAFACCRALAASMW
jgi:hypothetical protein